MNTAPLTTRWTGEALQPIGRSAKEADAYFVIGQTYRIVEHQERSQASHNHFFAAVHEAWSNLSDEQFERWPSAEHLRKWALVKAGYFDERSIVCASKAEAARVAAFVKPMDEFAIVTVSLAVVRVFTAKSQSTKAMGRKDFNESKQKVLDVIAGLIGVSTGDLRENAGRAA